MAKQEFPGVTPYLSVRDGRANEASQFYQRAFGAAEVRRHMADDGKRLLHAQQIGRAHV